MSVMRKVAQNTALQLIGKVLGTALGFGATLILLRYLGDEKYGNFTTAMAYLQLFGILTDLGLYIVLLKHISSDENADGKLHNNIFTLRFLSAVFFLAMAIVLVWFIPSYPDIVKWSVVVVAVNFFFITMNQLFMGVYQKHFAMGKVALAEIAGKIVLFLATIAVVYVFKADLLAVMLTVVLGGVVNFGVLAIGVRKYEHIRLAFDMSVWKRIAKESWPIAISIALNLIYFKADTFILGLFRSQAEVGIYGAPYKMLEVIITLPAMIVGLMMPVLSKQYSSNKLEDFKHTYQQTFDFLIMMAMPLVIGVLPIAHQFMRMVAGEDFTSASNQADLGKILQILIVAVGVIFIGTLSGYLVVIVNKQRSMVWGYGAVAVTALCGYLYFIPRYSYFGAAAVTVFSEAAITVVGLYLVYRATKFFPSLRTTFKVLLASAIMGGVVWLINDWNSLLAIAIGCVVYPLALLAVKGVSIQQLKSFLQLRSAHE